MRLTPTFALCLCGTLIGCNSVFGVGDYVGGTGGAGAAGGERGIGGADGGAGGSGGMNTGGDPSTTSAGGSLVGGAGGVGGMAPEPCGNGVLDANEECDLGATSEPYCIDCQVVCPGAASAAVRVGAPDEPHCYVGVPSGEQSDADDDCSALGTGWYLFEVNDLAEHDWLHANRSAVGLSSSKYFWTGARRNNGTYRHPNGQTYPHDGSCDPPDNLWATGEPCDGADTETCTALGLSTNDPGLNDVGCNEHNFEGICEWQP